MNCPVAVASSPSGAWTADVTARCISFLARLGHDEDRPAIDHAVAFLLREQEGDGSWFGRWGTNYIYGTWSVLCAFADAGLRSHPAVERAARWLCEVQGADGGWGEDERSYDRACYVPGADAQPSHTAWGMLGLMAAGTARSDVLAAGAHWLEAACRPDGTWEETRNAVGFPPSSTCFTGATPSTSPYMRSPRIRITRKIAGLDHGRSPAPTWLVTASRRTDCAG